MAFFRIDKEKSEVNDMIDEDWPLAEWLDRNEEVVETINLCSSWKGIAV